VKVIARNRKAFHDYDILERFEAGIELLGAEVKSLRAGRINLADSYATCQDGQVFVNHLHIGPYEQASRMTAAEPYRRRRLLLRKREIVHLHREVEQKRLALVPLQLYFKNQWVKVELGLGKGMKQYDKRQKIAADESKRRLTQLMKAARRG
jgi:SsrA-binding protein